LKGLDEDGTLYLSEIEAENAFPETPELEKEDPHGKLGTPISHSAHCVSSPGSYKLTTSSYHIFNPDTSSSSWPSGQMLQETHTLTQISPESREDYFPRYIKYTIKADQQRYKITEPSMTFTFTPGMLITEAITHYSFELAYMVKRMYNAISAFTNTSLNNQGTKQPGQLSAWPEFLSPAFSAHKAVSSDAVVLHKEQISLKLEVPMEEIQQLVPPNIKNYLKFCTTEVDIQDDGSTVEGYAKEISKEVIEAEMKGFWQRHHHCLHP
jgi:hypothetical protein